jgi:hypothetical protein
MYVHTENRSRQNAPSQTLSRRILAPLANPIALPSSLELTVKRRLIPAGSPSSTSLTIRLLLLVAAGAGVVVLSSAGESDSIIRPRCPREVTLGLPVPNCP